MANDLIKYLKDVEKDVNDTSLETASNKENIFSNNLQPH